MTRALPWKSAWITGASSGIGREMALRLAAGGCAVAASARSVDKLEQIAQIAPGIHAFPLDVTDAVATSATVTRIISEMGVPDLVVLNAGVGVFKSAARFDAELFRRTIETNVVGPGNALAAIIPPMVERGSGHIALMGSLAGYRGFPHSIHYAPSKAAIRSMADGLRFDLEEKGIMISVINPGYIETPMTADNQGPMPGLMPLAPAVDQILKGLAKRKFEIAFPWSMAAVVQSGAVISDALYFRITRWIMSR